MTPPEYFFAIVGAVLVALVADANGVDYAWMLAPGLLWLRGTVRS